MLVGVTVDVPDTGAQVDVLDGRSDLFSLGIVLCELALQSTLPRGLVYQRLKTGERPDSCMIPTEFLEQADDRIPGIRPILERLLQFRIERRYPHADALLDDIDALREVHGVFPRLRTWLNTTPMAQEPLEVDPRETAPTAKHQPIAPESSRASNDLHPLRTNIGDNLDCFMLTKPFDASDVLFVDKLLTQLELKLGMQKKIGLELLIEETLGLQNVEEIAASTPRLEAMVFGMGDYSASQGIDLSLMGGENGYPGDIFHYAKFRVAMAARAQGIDAIDGPFANIGNLNAYRKSCLQARALGIVGKWALHPTQIEHAQEIFTPDAEAVAEARMMTEAYREAEARGEGAVMIDGKFADVATVRLMANTLDLAELYKL